MRNERQYILHYHLITRMSWQILTLLILPTQSMAAPGPTSISQLIRTQSLTHAQRSGLRNLQYDYGHRNSYTILQQIGASNTDWGQLVNDPHTWAPIWMQTGKGDNLLFLLNHLTQGQRRDLPHEHHDFLVTIMTALRRVSPSTSGAFIRGLVQQQNQTLMHYVALIHFGQWQASARQQVSELRNLIEHANQSTLVTIASSLAMPEWATYPDLFQRVYERGDSHVRFNLIFSTLQSSTSTPVIRSVFDTSPIPAEMRYTLLNTIPGNGGDPPIRIYRYDGPRWLDHPDLLRPFLLDGNQEVLRNLASSVFANEAACRYPDLLRILIDRADQTTLRAIARNTFRNPAWLRSHPERVTQLIARGGAEIQQELQQGLYTRIDPAERLALIEAGQRRNLTDPPLEVVPPVPQLRPNTPTVSTTTTGDCSLVAKLRTLLVSRGRGF